MPSIIQITRSRTGTVYEAADLRIRTASVTLRDGVGWEIRSYYDDEDYDLDTRPSREAAERVAQAHTFRLTR